MLRGNALNTHYLIIINMSFLVNCFGGDESPETSSKIKHKYSNSLEVLEKLPTKRKLQKQKKHSKKPNEKN